MLDVFYQEDSLTENQSVSWDNTQCFKDVVNFSGFIIMVYFYVCVLCSLFPFSSRLLKSFNIYSTESY